MKLSLKILSLVLVFVITACGGEKEGDSDKKEAGASGFEGILAATYNSLDNAVTVITIDHDALKEKSDLANTLQKQMPGNGEITTILEQADGLLGKIHIIGAVDEFNPDNAENTKGSAVVLAKILDKEKFDNLLSMAPLGDTEEKYGFTVAELSEQAILAYNKEMLMVFFNAEGKAGAVMEKALTSNNTEMNELLAASIANNADISIYGNMEKFMGIYKGSVKDTGIPAEEYEKLIAMYKGSSMVVDFKFENGKFSTIITNDFAKKAGSDLNVFASKGLSKEILGKIGNNPIAIVSMNMNFQALWKFAKNFVKAEDIKTIDEQLASIGMSFDQVMGLMTGEFAFAFNGMAPDMETPNIGLFVGLTDPAAIEAIIPKDKATKDKNGIYTVDGKVSFYFGDKFLLVNSDKAFINAVIAGTQGDVNFGNQEAILTSPANYFLNFNTLTSNKNLMAVVDEATDGNGAVIKILDKAYGFGSLDRFEYVIETNDKSRNILIQIIEAVTNSMNNSGDFVNVSEGKADEIEKEF